MSKAGWFYAAGLTVIGVWLLSFLGNVQTPRENRSSAPSTSPLPVPAQTNAPEPLVTIMRATRVRSTAEEARLKKFVPARVTLRQDLEFRSPRVTAASVNVGQGREVNVVRVNGSELVVEYAGWETMVSISKTDFLDRVIAETEK